MIRRLTLSLAAACALLPAAAQAAPPTIVSVQADPKAIFDQAMTIDVTARSQNAAVNGVEISEAGVPGGFGASACRMPRRSGSAPPASGPLQPGREVSFAVPYLPATVGVHVLDVTVTAGDCGPKPERTTTRLSVTVTLPSTSPLPTSSVTPAPTIPPIPPIAAPLARASAAPSKCAGSDAVPTESNQRTLRVATVCLVNAERKAAGLSRLKSHPALKSSAAAHARDMLARRFFAHDAPGGPDLAGRVKKVRYWPAIASENLGTATGELATPRTMVQAWMDSEGHRHNILDRSVRQIGIAVIYRMYTGEAPGATYVANFGKKY